MWGQKGYDPKYLVYLVVLCFEKRYPTPNTVVRLKSKYLAPPKTLGWLHYCESYKDFVISRYAQHR